MPKGTEAQRTAYKTSLDKIYRKNLELKRGMTKKQIENEIKINANFIWESTKHEDVTTIDMQHLIIYTDLYGDDLGLYNCYPNEEITDGDDFDPSRTDKN